MHEKENHMQGFQRLTAGILRLLELLRLKARCGAWACWAGLVAAHSATATQYHRSASAGLQSTILQHTVKCIHSKRARVCSHTAHGHNCRADQPEAVREKLVPALLHGMASHHAGHLPGWKCMIENLFQRGLIKIVSVNRV